MTVGEINDKVRDYLSIGVKRVILIDPVYRNYYSLPSWQKGSRIL